LAKADPHSAQAQRDLSVSLEKLGDVEVQAGNLARARELFARSLEIREELAKADPHSAQAQRDLSVSLERLGRGAGRQPRARPRALRPLAGRSRRSWRRPTRHSAQAAFDVVFSRVQFAALSRMLGEMESLREHLEVANILLTEMDRRGQVAGFTQREQFRIVVQGALAKLPPRKPQK
jgi:hypothetical protein